MSKHICKGLILAQCRLTV